MSTLVEGFDAVVCDLDGVVVSGSATVPHAVEALNGVGVPVVYATNNASRTRHEVGEMLRGHGVRADDGQVLTSSLAAARDLASQVPAGSPVLAVGGPGVAGSLRAVGLEPLTAEDDREVVAVVQGYGSGVTAADLAAAAVAVRDGAMWIATNEDLTLPTDRGPVPGNGSLVAAVRAAVGGDPLVIGKPHPPMYELAAELVRARPERTLAVGDRLETDIAGASAAGVLSALVLTGVHRVPDAAGAGAHERPTYVIEDLRGLHQEYPRARTSDGWCQRGTARARYSDGLEVVGAGINAVRASLDAIWSAVDAGRITPEEARRLSPTG